MRSVQPSSVARSVPSWVSGSARADRMPLVAAPAIRSSYVPVGSGSSGPPQRAARSGSTARQVLPRPVTRRGDARAGADELDGCRARPLAGERSGPGRRRS